MMCWRIDQLRRKEQPNVGTNVGTMIWSFGFIEQKQLIKLN